jgi:8-oxo-dGTP pyrophosphatase MutT (NUDIX family)
MTWEMAPHEAPDDKGGDSGRDGWARALSTGTLDVGAVTTGQPFCAGVLIVHDGQLLCTLGTEGLPEPPGRFRWRVGGVGGGQEPGEDIWQCAGREALEELGQRVLLVPSPVTYLGDVGARPVPVRCTDGPAPFCVHRQWNADPVTPFRPDLPAGPYTYYGLFLARPAGDGREAFTPNDDAEALLRMPLACWDMLTEGPTVRDVLAVGAEVVGTTDVDPAAALWLPADESLTTVAPLLAAHPELEDL